MNLTLVIPTIPGRESLLSRCLWSIQQQPEHADVLVIGGTAGQGDKANHAAGIVKTSHMALVDDDDYLDAHYLASVLPLLRVDYVGFKILSLENGKFLWVAETRGDGITSTLTKRKWGPVTKGVLRTSIWQRTPFRNGYGDDRHWHPGIQSHAFVDRVLYVYDYWGASSYFDGTGARDVGEWPVDWSRVQQLTLDAVAA